MVINSINDFKLRLLVLILFINISVSLKGQNEMAQELKVAKVRLDLPNDNWFLADRQENDGMIVYFFKRKPLEDDEGRQIIPNISIIIEDVDKKLDAIEYSAIKRIKVPFDVLEVYTYEDGIIDFKNAVGYKGKYTDQYELNHTIYVVHGINAKKGLQIICDVTTSILDKVEPEFLKTLKSIQKF